MSALSKPKKWLEWIAITIVVSGIMIGFFEGIGGDLWVYQGRYTKRPYSHNGYRSIGRILGDSRRYETN